MVGGFYREPRIFSGKGCGSGSFTSTKIGNSKRRGSSASNLSSKDAKEGKILNVDEFFLPSSTGFSSVGKSDFKIKKFSFRA